MTFGKDRKISLSSGGPSKDKDMDIMSSKDGGVCETRLKVATIRPLNLVRKNEVVREYSSGKGCRSRFECGGKTSGR
jgi:hypothetical protein